MWLGCLAEPLVDYVNIAIHLDEGQGRYSLTGLFVDPLVDPLVDVFVDSSHGETRWSVVQRSVYGCARSDVAGAGRPRGDGEHGLGPFDPHGGVSEVGTAVGEVSDVGPVPEDDAHRLMGEEDDACYGVARYFR